MDGPEHCGDIDHPTPVLRTPQMPAPKQHKGPADNKGQRANGAFGRHEPQDRAGMRLATAASDADEASVADRKAKAEAEAGGYSSGDRCSEFADVSWTLNHSKLHFYLFRFAANVTPRSAASDQSDKNEASISSSALASTPNTSAFQLANSTSCQKPPQSVSYCDLAIRLAYPQHVLTQRPGKAVEAWK